MIILKKSFRVTFRGVAQCFLLCFACLLCLPYKNWRERSTTAFCSVWCCLPSLLQPNIQEIRHIMGQPYILNVKVASFRHKKWFLFLKLVRNSLVEPSTVAHKFRPPTRVHDFPPLFLEHTNENDRPTERQCRDQCDQIWQNFATLAKFEKS